MHELWSSTSYEPHLLSLPLAFAPAVMAVAIAYALVMRGEPRLRFWLLLHFITLLPYSVAIALSPSLTSPVAAEAMFRVAVAFVPASAVAGAGFQFALLGHRPRAAAVAAGAVAVAWIALCSTTNAAVDGVYWLPVGLWFPSAGRYSWVFLLATAGFVTPGFLMMGRRALRDPPGLERRQLRFFFVANACTCAGLVDVALAYHIALPMPLGWLLSGLGSAVVVRALLFEDLLRVRAVDVAAPQLLLHLAIAVLIGWISLALEGGQPTWWGAAITLGLAFAGARVIVAVLALIARGAKMRESTLDRMLAQLVTRARGLRGEPEIARLAADIIELGVGARPVVLLAAADDWGWFAADGARVPDDAAPDPLLGPWLAEQHGAIRASELATRAPEELRVPLGDVLARAKGSVLVPIANGDELVALLLVPGERSLRGRELVFVESAGDRLGEALVYARMAKRAEERATLAREVDLAATVQAHLLPGRAPHEHAGVTVVGSWLPATRCAGDFWAVYALGGKTLVAVGDVTGHGVASATVTAAAWAACDVCVRRHGAALELPAVVAALDAAVARTSGGKLVMSCFAAILDPASEQITYVSCGHPAPYLCRNGARGIELHALAARGNPLGGGAGSGAKPQHRSLEAGDVVVCYTDGVIDVQDPRGEPFGDRRMQRLLRRLDPQLAAVAIHDLVTAAVEAHRAGRPRGDDETLVVAHVRPRT